MVLIARYVAIGGIWVLTTYIAYIFKTNNSNVDKLKTMSCRHELKGYKRLDEADSKSLW